MFSSPGLGARRRNAASVAEERETCAVTFALFRGLVFAKFRAIFRIQCFGASTCCFKWQAVPAGEFSQVRVRTRQPVRYGSLRRGYFGRRLGAKHSDGVAG